MSCAARVELQRMAGSMRMGFAVQPPPASLVQDMGDVIDEGLWALAERERDQAALDDMQAQRDDAERQCNGLRTELEDVQTQCDGAELERKTLRTEFEAVRAELVKFGALAAKDYDTDLAALLRVLLA